MTRGEVAATLALCIGWVLFLGALRPVRQPSLVHRLEDRLDGIEDHQDRPSWQFAAITSASRPLWRSSVLGRAERNVRRRLERAGSAVPPRHLAIVMLVTGGAGLLAGLLLSSATTSAPLRLGVPLVGLALGGLAPLGLLEQRAERRQAARADAFPLLVEHLAMLAGHGFAMNEAFDRLERRWRHSAIGDDLAGLCRRLAQGVDPAVAVADWAAANRFPPGRRLADALRATATSSDCERVLWQLGRAERERNLVALIHRFQVREQQVWIPVTVAALVPGMLLLVLPFARALHALGAA